MNTEQTAEQAFLQGTEPVHAQEHHITLSDTKDGMATDLVSGNMKHAMREAKATSRDLWFVPVSELTILDDFNVRTKNEQYTEDVRLIADSIKENGFYPHKPFAVIIMKRDGKDIIAVYDGHTRYDALQLAISEDYRVETVPCVAAPSGTTREDITVGLVTNNSGRTLEPMAIATVCKRLVSYGVDKATIAKRLGYTPPYVGGLLNLIGAPKKIRDMVNSGAVSASLAVATLRDQGERAVEVLEKGMVTAKQKGKDKVTARSLPTKPEKSAASTSTTPTPRKLTPLESGLTWINDNGQMEHSYAMLSAITGMTIPELKKTQL